MTMTSYVDQGENERAQNKDLSNALVIGLTIAVSLFLLSLVSWFLFEPVGRTPNILVPISSLFFALIGIILVQQNRVTFGICLALIALAASYVYLITQFGGVGAIVSIVYTLVVIGAVRETFPPTVVARVVGFSLILGLLMLMLDLFWPGARRPPLPRDLAPLVLIAVLTGLIVIFYSLRRFPHFSLREKLITAFVAVALLPLIILVILSNNATKNVLIWDANQRLQAAAGQTANAVDDYLANSLQTIRTEASLLEEIGYLDLAIDQRLGSGSEANTIAQLKTYRDKDPLNISSYALLDTQGLKLLEYPLNSTLVDESGSNYVTTPLETGKPYVSPVTFTPIVGGPFIYFSAPVRNEADQIVGVLRARVKASTLQQLITRSTGLVGGQSFAVLFDENFLHLAHGTAPETLFTLVAPLSPERTEELQSSSRLPSRSPEELTTNLPDLFEKLVNSDNEPFFTSRDVATDNRLDQIAVTRTENQPWLVAFFQPQDVFLTPVENQTRTAIILSVGVTVAVVAVAVILAGLLTGPISRLQETAERVAQGNLHVRANIENDDEIGALARTFNQTTSRLQETLQNLEQRVADRTRALTMSTEVGRRLSTILDQQQLVSEVVGQVQEAFGYYHVHIYLFDEGKQNLIMVGGTGEPGRIMLERGHKIDEGKGLVGRAAALNSVVLVPDVRRDPDWLSNPLLPETKSEVAVPIAIGDQVLGVLDVQDDKTNSLGQQDSDLLLSISSQVAIALQNARTYAETQRQAEQRALINEINRKIQSAFDPEKAMQIAVRELGRATGSRYTRVWLDNPEDGSNGNSFDKEE